MTPRTLEDFLSLTEQAGDCLNWTRALNTDGYPRAAIKGNYNVKVHRHVYSLAHPEEDIEGRVIRHTCDNPKCINPDHLLSGTFADNAWDRASRKRNYLRSFGEDQVREIRKLYNSGEHTQKSLAHLFNTQQGSIRQIVLGMTYKWVTDNLQED